MIITGIGVVGFLAIDPSAGIVKAFFMTPITPTTVGYGEGAAVDTDPARVFTAVPILVGMGAVLYFVSTGTAFLLEGQLGHVFRRRRMERALAEMQGHRIVCGSGRTARYAAELAAVKRDVVLLVAAQEDAEKADSDLPDLPIIVGDARTTACSSQRVSIGPPESW